MLPHFSTPELQSFPLTMVVSHILNPGQDFLKKISINILNRITQPIIVVNQHGQVVAANKAFNELSGDALTENYVQFEEINFANEDLSKYLDFGIPIANFQDKLMVNEFTQIPICMNIYPIFSNTKNRTGAVCLVNDITSEISYNKLLKQSEIILNTINTGVIAIDISHRITMFNKFAEKCFGVSQRMVIGELFDTFTSKFIDDQEHMVGQLTKQKEIRDYELSLTINGRKNYFICDTYLLKKDTNENETDGMIIFFKDITGIKEIELQLARSEKLSVIGELAAGTAHEIRNPMTTVRGFIQIIQKKHQDMAIDEFNDYFVMMLNEIDRVNKIISDFLDLAKPKQSEYVSLDINELLNEVLFIMENEALRQNIDIKTKLTPTLPPAYGDKHQLKQVFLNIISNAFQAMSERGLLTIKSWAANDNSQLIIEFSDNGKGIAPELLDKIFDPFISTREDGTGLGLAISNRIITDHHGEIKVNSKPGEGTNFIVILPAINQ